MGLPPGKGGLVGGLLPGPPGNGGLIGGRCGKLPPNNCLNIRIRIKSLRSGLFILACCLFSSSTPLFSTILLWLLFLFLIDALDKLLEIALTLFFFYMLLLFSSLAVLLFSPFTYCTILVLQQTF